MDRRQDGQTDWSFAEWPGLGLSVMAELYSNLLKEKEHIHIQSNQLPMVSNFCYFNSQHWQIWPHYEHVMARQGLSVYPQVSFSTPINRFGEKMELGPALAVGVQARSFPSKYLIPFRIGPTRQFVYMKL